MKTYIQGCLINTERDFIKIGYSKEVNIIDNYLDRCLYINIPRKFRWSDLVDRRFEIHKDQIISETSYIKVPKAEYSINGLKFRKSIPNNYVFSQYLIRDISEYTMYFDEIQCQLLIPQKFDYNFDKYLTLLKLNPYLEILDSNIISLKNFYGINLTDKNIKIESNNDFSFNTKSFYEKYLLEPIDIQYSFITQLKPLFSSYGLDIIRYPIDSNVKTVDHVVYRFTDTGKQISHKSGYYPLNYAIQQQFRIDFELTTPNLALLNDFKTKYQNLDLISNFTTFNTTDKLGRSWSSNVNWQPIGTDFNQDYDQDTQGNQAMKTNFGAEVTYYVVYDQVFYDIQKTILSITATESNLNKISV